MLSPYHFLPSFGGLVSYDNFDVPLKSMLSLVEISGNDLVGMKFL